MLFGIEDLLLDEISQRAVILLQIENAIPRLEIKMLAVELAAEFQPTGKGLLRHARIKNLAFEFVNCLILRADWGQRHQAKGNRAADKRLHGNLSKNAARTISLRNTSANK